MIMPAYAITVHKSQGSEYGVVIIPFVPRYGGMLQRNLLYTAVTRAKRKSYYRWYYLVLLNVPYAPLMLMNDIHCLKNDYKGDVIHKLSLLDSYFHLFVPHCGAPVATQGDWCKTCFT